uniref:Transcriptional regulator n=1 Tax=Heterorhabditis bacteriophora TaxID=37862 RepID=A0A1I7WFR6_HETBA
MEQFQNVSDAEKDRLIKDLYDRTDPRVRLAMAKMSRSR